MSTDLALRPAQAGSLSIGALKLEGMDDLARVAQLIAKSGMFRDAKTPEQVGVKMLFAMTMGFSPVAGLTGVDLIDGSPTPNAHFWAAAIEDSPIYDYEVKERTNERCTVAFSRWDERTGQWRHRGQVTWTLEDARQAGLLGKDNWKKYPRAMLWARAMTEGGRTFCPGLFGGVRAYEPGELGSEAEPPPTVASVGEVLPFDGAEEPPADPPDDRGGMPVGDVVVITPKQVTRLQTIRSKSGMPEEDYRALLRDRTGQDSTKGIPWSLYDEIVKTVEAYEPPSELVPEEKKKASADPDKGDS